MNRRGFLGSILALAAAPAIVRASSIMPVRAPLPPGMRVFGMDFGADEKLEYAEYFFEIPPRTAQEIIARRDAAMEQIRRVHDDAADAFKYAVGVLSVYRDVKIIYGRPLPKDRIATFAASPLMELTRLR